MELPPLTLLPWLLAGAAGLLAASCLRRLRVERRARAEADSALAARETMLLRIGQAVDSASDAIGIGDMESNSLYHNRAHLALFGYTVEELNANPEPAALFADKSTALQIHASIREGRSWSGETEIKDKRGRVIPAFVRADIIRDAEGRAVGIFGVFTDITERRLVLRLLEEQRQRLRLTLENTSDAIITTDAAGHVVLFNPAAARLLGVDPARAAGRPLAELLAPRDETTRLPRELPLAALLRAPRTQRSVDAYRFDPADGGPERLVAEHAALIRGDDGAPAGAVLVLRDVTRERRRAEETARAERLESLGLLASGVAHDFGNLVMAMIAQSTLLRLAPDLPEGAVKRLDTLDATFDRARALTAQLASFARNEAPDRRPAELGPLLAESLRLAVTGSRVEGELDCAAGLPAVLGDATQLVQLFNNLCVNAVQAMPGGGRLRVAAARLPREDSASALPAAAPEDFVRVTVEDDGPGIQPEVLPRIFDPFFTTKATGNGLGLATCHAIVRRHGGRIRADSAPGRGTSFEILLPVAR